MHQREWLVIGWLCGFHEVLPRVCAAAGVVPVLPQVLPQQYGGKAELLPLTEAVRRFKLPPYPHLPELRQAKAAAAAAGLSSSAASEASEAPSADDSSGPNAAFDAEGEEISEFHDAEEDFAAAEGRGRQAAAENRDVQGGKLQQQQELVAVQARPGTL